MRNPTSSALEVELIERQVWQPFLDQALSTETRLTADQMALLARTTTTLIRTLHDRHVGITPELAVGLARLLVLPGAQSRVQGPWQAVLDRLRRELHRTTSNDRSSLRSTELSDGFVLRDAPTYTILRLALPLLERACARLGRSVLCCIDALKNGVSAQEYGAYAAQLAEQVRQLAEQDQHRPTDEEQVFWAEIALTLASRTQSAASGDAAPPLAEADPIALGLLLRLRPDPEPRIQSQARPRVMLSTRKRQKSRRLHEDGVSGYRLTRRMEDLDEIVMSELLYPAPVLLDRVLNTGYLVLERPPRHQKQRDVLTVGVLPPSLFPKPSAALLKACWFDCQWRFAAFLREQSLQRSEIRWIEGETTDSVRSVSYGLADLPSAADEIRTTPAERWFFLKALRWIPSFLNKRARPTMLTLPAQPARNEPPEQALPPEAVWLRAAWDAQREHRRAESHEPVHARPRSWPEAVDEFAHVHVMIFLPAAVLNVTPDDRRATAIRMQRRFASRMRLAKGAGVYISLTFVPDHPSAVDQWLVVNSAGASGPEPHHAAPNALAADLERIWLDRLIKDMCRG